MDADLNLAILDDDRISAQTIKQLRLGSDGTVYGLTQNGDVFTLENGVVKSFLSSDDAPIDGIMSILLDDDNPGYLYLGTESSQIMYGRLGKYFYAEKVLNVAPLSGVDAMEYIGGKIWICAGNGIGSADDEGFHGNPL